MATTIQFKTLTQLVQIQLDYIAANAPVVLNTPLGPFVTAICYANALVALSLQRLIQLVLASARLSTSRDGDVDSFVEDFGMSRAPGVKAAGEVLFSRYVTAVSQIVIPVGSIVQTSSAPPVQYQVVGDTTNADFDQSQNAYILKSGNTQITALVECLQVGTAGNALIGQINKIGSALPGIDNVSNAEAFDTGQDQETDDQLKERFSLYIQSLSKATKTAVESAISDVQPGLIYKVFENVNSDGTTNNGQIIVTVDDGSGSPSNNLKARISQAVDRVRPVGVRHFVLGPTSNVTCFGHIVVAYDPILVPDVIALRDVIGNAIINYINATSFKEQVRISQAYKAIWQAVSPGDAVETAVVASPVSQGNVVYVASTFGLEIGQLANIGNRVTASGTFPTIIAIDTDQSITIFPPLTTLPQAGDIVKAFTILPGQILNINGLELGVATSVAISTASGLPVNYLGSALNGNVAGVVGTATAIYVSAVTGFSVNDPIVLPGYQPDPATNNPSVSVMRPKIVKVETGPPARLIVQPPLGTIAKDGTWTGIQTAPGVGAVFAGGSLVWEPNLGGEVVLAPPLGPVLTQVTRTNKTSLMITMTPTVA